MGDKIRQRDHRGQGFEGLLDGVDDEGVLGWEPELETSEIFFLEILELDDVLAGFDYRPIRTIELEMSYNSHEDLENLDQMSKNID